MSMILKISICTYIYTQRSYQSLVFTVRVYTVFTNPCIYPIRSWQSKATSRMFYPQYQQFHVAVQDIYIIVTHIYYHNYSID